MRTSHVMRALGAAGLMALSACGSEQALMDTSPGAGPLQASAFAEAGPVREYTVNPQDRLSIGVFPDRSLTLPDIRVDENGSILVPPLGPVQVEGRTTAQISQTITDGLARCCLRSPQVSVQIIEAVSQQFTVTGAVKTPNSYVMRGRVNLLQAVSMAGGPDTTIADLKRVGVIRMVNGQRAGRIFNLQKIMAGQEADPQIMAGDQIIVDSSRLRGAWKDILSAIPLMPLIAVL